MSKTETQSETEYTQVICRKCKVGPLTERYQNGGWNNIDPRQTDDKPTRKGQIELNNKYHGDYKVGYASDPLIVISAEKDLSHQQLKELLSDCDMFRNRFQEIELPDPSGGYKPAFQAPPEDADFIESFKKRLKDANEQYAPLERPNGITVYLPTQ